MSAPYNPTGNGISENSVKLCKWALRRASLTKQSPNLLLRQRQSLWLSDCQASAQELFLKRRITPNHLSINRSTIKELDWGKEINSREAVRVQRTENMIKKSKTVKNYKIDDQVIIQDLKKRWTLKGKITQTTLSKNSYIIMLEDGTFIERHRHMIRDDKSHPNYQMIETISPNEEIDSEDTVQKNSHQHIAMSDEEIDSPTQIPAQVRELVRELGNAADAAMSRDATQTEEGQTGQTESQFNFERPYTRSRGEAPTQSWII
jgi:hypothetical protein